MTKIVYASALAEFWRADIDVEADTIKVQLVDADYTYNAAHDFLDDVPAGARIGTAQTIGSKTFGVVAAGVFDGADVTFTAVTAGDTVVGYVIYDDTPATEATKPLLVFVNEDAAAGAISIATNGGDIGLTWSASGIAKI
jgi:hypothetical protein